VQLRAKLAVVEPLASFSDEPAVHVLGLFEQYAVDGSAEVTAMRAAIDDGRLGDAAGLAFDACSGEGKAVMAKALVLEERVLELEFVGVDSHRGAQSGMQPR